MTADSPNRRKRTAKPSDSTPNLGELINDYAAPRYDVFYPTQTWNEILPGLFLGGTAPEDDLASDLAGNKFGMPATLVNKDNFDTVVTLYAWARPADWFVKELRLGILDGPMSNFNLEDLKSLVFTAHTDWKSGRRVLVRCQAGINRSSLIMALLLIRDGLAPDEAITLMRNKRGMAVLANGHFVEWLTNLDTAEWRA
jgi:hypothetical protein